MPWVASPLPALDSWEDLWREKARWKVERSGRPSDVSMIARRFELVVRWVETELVRAAVSGLFESPPSQRCRLTLCSLFDDPQILAARAGRSSLVVLVERFIKLAAALFQLSNLQCVLAENP